MLEWLNRHRNKAVAALVVVIPLAMVVSSSGPEVGEPTVVTPVGRCDRRPAPSSPAEPDARCL